MGGAKAPAGSFHATNMLVNSEGFLVPRSGLADITPASMPNGTLLALGTTDTPTKNGIFVIGNTVYLFDITNPTAAPITAGTLGTTPTVPLSIQRDTTNRLIAVPGDKIYTVDPIGVSVTPYSSSPPSNDCVVYGNQLIAADTATPYQVDASEPADFTDWSSGRSLDAGDNWQVTALFVQRNTLAILKREGILAMSGILGDPSTEVTRTMSTAQGPLHPQHAAIDADDMIWFWPFTRQDIGYFNGSRPLTTGHIQAPDLQRDGDPATLPMVRGMSVLMGDLSPSSVAAVQAGTDQFMALMHNSIWTYHTFGTTISGMTAHDPYLERLIITDGGGTSTSAEIFTMMPQLNRPVIAADTLVSPGDNSTTPLNASVTFPQYWVAPYRRYPVPSVRVRQLVIDFKAYNTGLTGSTKTNHFDIVIKSIGKNGQGDVTHTFADPYDADPSGYSTSGDHVRKVCNTLLDLTGGFEVSLTNVRGVAIRSAMVHFEMDTDRPRS